MGAHFMGGPAEPTSAASISLQVKPVPPDDQGALETVAQSISRVSVELSDAAHVLAAGRAAYVQAREQLVAAEARFRSLSIDLGGLVKDLEEGKG